MLRRLTILFTALIYLSTAAVAQPTPVEAPTATPSPSIARGPELRPDGGCAERPAEEGTLLLAQACCRMCSTGKACGNSCISRNYTCHKPPGCACDR